MPWFLQDISTYGIGIFTPVIIGAVFGAELGGHSVSAVIHDDLLGAKGAAFVDLAFVAGIAVAIALADRWGRIPLQVLGFIGCAVGLALATALQRRDAGRPGRWQAAHQRTKDDAWRPCALLRALPGAGPACASGPT